MNYFYLDTSALFKRYHDESGSKFINDLFDNRLKFKATFFVSALSAVEFCSAVRRHQRERGIDNDTAEGIINCFFNEAEHTLLAIPFEQHLIQTSIGLLARHPLKGYDSVQLASCIEAIKYVGQSENFYFVCDDERLSNAAQMEGLYVVPPRRKESIELLNHLSY